MPETRDDGGPAFPKQHTIADANDPSFKLGFNGMSLRDYFAGQVLATAKIRQEDLAADWSDFANACYHIADAMLEARKR